MNKTIVMAAITSLLPAAALAEFSVQPYGSIRMQAEHVSVDQAKAGEDDSHTALRDAYTRFGVKASYPLNNGTTLGGVLEIPFNTQQMEAEDPAFFEGYYKSNSSPRVAKITASGDWGSLALGKQWLTYYNHIGAVVDQFSSFYSGFTSYAIIRREAVTYTTPDISGFNATVSMVDLVDGGDENYLDTQQYAVSYNWDGLNLALSYQNSYDGVADLLGFAATYTTGPWHFATKVEQIDSPDSVSSGKDPLVYNLYTAYQQNNYTFKAHYAQGDESDDGSAFFQGTSYHFGVDYQYTPEFKVFVEYFYEDRGSAIYTPNSESYDVLTGFHTETDGSAIALGFRYDF